MFRAILLSSLIVLGSQGPPQEFQSAIEALFALDRMGECKCDTDVKAYRYFINNPDESIPLLVDFTLKHKQRHYVGVPALSRIRDERVITFLIQLADDELHNRTNKISDDNAYNEVHPYDSEGLISHLIAVLGDYGDKRAIPIIEDSLRRLNNQHRDSDLEALSKLGKIAISELHEMHLESEPQTTGKQRLYEEYISFRKGLNARRMEDGYVAAIRDIKSQEAEDQKRGLAVLAASGEIDAIAWIAPLIDSDDVGVTLSFMTLNARPA